MGGKLVLYFSFYGTAKVIAETIARQTGADLLAIEPAIPFNMHLSFRDSGTYETIRQLESKAEVLEGLPVETQNTEKGLEAAVQKWLIRLCYYEVNYA